MRYPLMFALRQKLHGPKIEDVPAAVDAELSTLNLGSKVRAGDTVAIACGRRPMANYVAIVKAVVDHFKHLEASPFLVPAIGSHGPETTERQREILQDSGINERTVGAEIRWSIETRILGQLPEGVPIHFATQALAADHTFVLNRVNLHPVFHGNVQSGVLEIIAIGLGDLDATQLRVTEGEFSFEDIARAVHKLILKKANLLAGLMIVQSGDQSTARVQAAFPEEFVVKEKAMLNLARKLFPRLPFKFIDILLVDEIGPAFDCLGADLNVIGRKHHAHTAADGEFPQIKTIVYRDLNRISRGNATGIGNAEFVRSRLLQKTEVRVTRLNSLAIGMPTLAATPIDFETDKEILDAALALIGLTPPEKARIAWIRNTSSLLDFECSEPYLEEVQHWKDLSVLGGLHAFDFDPHGNLRDFVIEPA